MQKKQKKSVSGAYSQLEDTTMKAAAQFFGERLLPYVGVKERFVRVAPTEIPRLEVRKLYEDFNFEMENGWWYHFEFESDSITLEDLKRFREYEAAASRLYQVPVVTAVICTSKAKKLLSEFSIGVQGAIRLRPWKFPHFLCNPQSAYVQYAFIVCLENGRIADG